MRQFTLNLAKQIQRPTVLIQKPNSIDAMLDTGALFPVWTANEERLAELGAVLIRTNIPFGGFGGMTAGNLYKIPVFHVGELVFPDFPVVASRQHLPCQMLLSATMFNGLIYEIDDCNHKLNITIPDTASTVRKLFVDENMHVFCTNGETQAVP